MHESTMSYRESQPLVMRWIPVRKPGGRTAMESCWLPASATAASTATGHEFLRVTHAA